MPELPEVETVRRGLHRRFVGQQLHGVEVYHPRTVRRHLAGMADFSARLVDRTISDTGRRGKFMWLTLDDETTLLCHLGMSGQFLAQEADHPTHKHLRTRFRFTSGQTQLWFVDQRTFGHLQLSDVTGNVPQAIEHIGPDPFEGEFDIDACARRLRSRRSPIKTALLDQSLVSGIGNIYADEALWRSGVHGLRRCSHLAIDEAHTILKHAREVMAEAIEAGGTSFDDLYVNTNGESGYFERSLDAYGRAGQPCRCCQSIMRREVIGGRSSYSCPRCQS
ncbi:bifunctional DNA-formamidopyrimidine glycosylase/DNA-(apurinic or apyrimidinic site) lyase [Natronoglycomyces albus]|uniref:Formamidopyrimidine-DNA glycosylase n=1 Tax=Natronoglycomyces albus TaxID=2811108 RepID=A0A895XKB7_9ACTN|nr:bifunctional DNA-formamidopyrimidine glycosylase/DNA-(apurinic or apyrimidinic site) lyase [Natronoglycomyces albus]QSB06191.1 bifunctional DNA-formamidopyrimidine glycosylase/DNA-(apurinic or apyrimidinic site) lyase [Natronoglycomyces albus]